MAKPIIIVLEDMQERVEWLKSSFADIAEIVWTTTVDSFFDKLTELDRSRLKLILLDHDLGGIPISLAAGSVGADGKDGRDAVDCLDDWSDIPTIVWSVNNVTAPQMVADLKDKGFTTGWMPFMGMHFPAIKAAIAQLIQ